MLLDAIRGIKLKIRQERKEQRALQSQHKFSTYIPHFIAKIYCELTCNDGFFSFKDGSLPDGKYIYIRTLAGEIFAAKESEVAHHSYLSNGKKVLSAGFFIFKKGKLCLVSNESGHYKPTNEEMMSEIGFYYQRSQNADLIYEDHSKFPTQKRIDHYQAREIIGKSTVDDLEPIATFNNRKSNFGKEVISPNSTNFRFFPRNAEKINSSNYNDPEEILLKPDDLSVSHYLPDYQLLGEYFSAKDDSCMP